MIIPRICSALLVAVLLSVGGTQSTEYYVIRDADREVVAATAKVIPEIECDWSEDEVGLKVARLKATYPTQQLVRIAKECSVESPLKIQIELPTKMIKQNVEDTNSNQVVIDITMSSILKKENVVCDKISLDKEIINLGKELSKPIEVRIVGEDGIEQYSWNLENAQITKDSLNLYMEIEKSTQIPDEIILAMGQRGRQSLRGTAIVHLFDHNKFKSKIGIKVGIDTASDWEEGKVLYGYRADLTNNGYNLVSVGKIHVDVNHQISLDVEQGGYYLLLDKPLDS